MAAYGLAEQVLPESFRKELDRLVLSKGMRTNNNTRNVSHMTLTQRKTVLARVFAELYVLGFKIPRPLNLRSKHVEALVADWVAKGKGAALIQNNLSMLRLFAGWIGKDGMVRPTQSYVDDKDLVRRSVVAKENKAWDSKGINPLDLIEQAGKEDKRVAIYLQLMHAFGLRLQEAVCLKPLRDIVMDGRFLSVLDGTKGGRHRMVPIENDYQREALSQAQALSDKRSGRIYQRDKTQKQAYNRARYVMRKLGLTRDELGVTAHGLRHQYAQSSYTKITGVPTPIEGGAPEQIDRFSHTQACYEVMERLGHSRVDVGGSYYGSHGHALRTNPGDPHMPWEKPGEESQVKPAE